MHVYPSSFFGLTCYPSKSYTTTLEEDTHLTMATLNAELPKNGSRSSLVITIDGNSFSLCSLTPGKVENQTLDIVLTQDAEVTFKIVGNCPIDITGKCIDLVPAFPMGEEDDEMFGEMGDSEEEDEEIDSDTVVEGMGPVGSSDEDELTPAEIERLKALIAEGGEQDEDDSDSGSDAMEFDEFLMAELEKRNKRAGETITRNDKKAKITEIIEEEEEQDSQVSDDDEEEDASTTVEVESVSQKQVKSKAEIRKVEPKKTETAPKKVEKEKKKAENPKEEAKSEKNVRKLPSGLIIEEVTVGTGPKAKKGKKVSVRYIGKLLNGGKVFDSNTKGAPFSFKLGKGEVIKGWDLGVDGMNVGGSRKLTIPAPLAYGAKGAAPDIPKNATLVFEVKLLDVK